MSGVVFISCVRSAHSKQVACRAAADGCDVYCGVDDLALIDEMVAANVTPIQLDVACENSVANATKTVLKSAGRIDHVFYTSHHNSFGGIEDHDATDAHYQFHVNLFGAMRVLRAFGPFLRSQNAGSFTICSAGILEAGRMAAGWHNACEAAIASIAETAKREFADFNVTFNHILIELGALKNVKLYAASHYGATVPKTYPSREHDSIMTGQEFVAAALDMLQPLGRFDPTEESQSANDDTCWCSLAGGLRRLLP